MSNDNINLKWPETVYRDLQRIVEEVKDELLAEYREEIKEILRRLIEADLEEMFGVKQRSLSKDHENLGQEWDLSDLPPGPEISVMSKKAGVD